MIITAQQKQLARHALGLPNSKRRSYRNRFVCPDADPHWSSMVENGLATVRKGETLPFDGDACFYLTRKGAEAALEPREKLSPEDFPVIQTRPILFRAPMIRALIDGRKTQTRRILKPQPSSANSKFVGFSGVSDTKAVFISEYPAQPETVRLPYSVGDRLWVRETWRCNGWAPDFATIMYRAHERNSYTEMTEHFPVAAHKPIEPTGTWKPSIFMPRWASRLTLTVKDMRVQRLQDISEEDAISEGIEKSGRSDEQAWLNYDKSTYAADGWTYPTNSFRTLWNSINGANAWDQNPWVTALTFTVEKRNIDQVPA